MTPEQALAEVLRMAKGDKQRVVAVPALFIKLLQSDFTAAAFLAQCLHWQRYAGADAWWCKGWREFAQLGFTRRQVDKCKRKLAPYLEWHKASAPPRTHYRLRLVQLHQAILQLHGSVQLNAQNRAIECTEPCNQLHEGVQSNARNGAHHARTRATNCTDPCNWRELNLSSNRRGTDLTESEMHVDKDQTPTPRCAASLERLSSSNGGGASADSHIHISDSDLALLAQRYGIRFARQPSPWAAVIIRTVLNGEGGEGHIEILRTLAARGSGDFGGAVAAAPREANTTVGG